MILQFDLGTHAYIITITRDFLSLAAVSLVVNQLIQTIEESHYF